MFKGIRYFSVAVTNLDEAIEHYEKLFGLQVLTPPNERRFGFISATLGNGEQSLIELIQPSGDESNLGRFMKERAMPSNPNGEGIYMVSIEVDDIEKTVEQIKEQGGRITQNEQTPNEAWVHPTSANFAFLGLVQPSS